MRRYARVDGNQREIIKALRQCGARVFDASGVGDGFPDLVVLFRRQVVLLEVKDGRKPPSKRQLTPAEAEFHAQWTGAPIHVVASIDQAISVLEGLE